MRHTYFRQDGTAREQCQQVTPLGVASGAWGEPQQHACIWPCAARGAVVQWCSGAVVQWCSGAVVQWCSGLGGTRRAGGPCRAWNCDHLQNVMATNQSLGGKPHGSSRRRLQEVYRA